MTRSEYNDTCDNEEKWDLCELVLCVPHRLLWIKVAELSVRGTRRHYILAYRTLTAGMYV